MFLVFKTHIKDIQRQYWAYLYQIFTYFHEVSCIIVLKTHLIKMDEQQKM